MQRIAAPMPESGKGAAMLYILCITRAKEPRSERGSRERERERNEGGRDKEGNAREIRLVFGMETADSFVKSRRHHANRGIDFISLPAGERGGGRAIALLFSFFSFFFWFSNAL